MIPAYLPGLVSGGLGMLGKAIQGAPPSYQADPELRKRMKDQRQRYEQMAKGRGPSLGRQMLQEGLERGMGQQRAMAQSARGGALQQSLARRQAQNVGAQMAGQAGRQAAMLRAQEQQAAMSGLDRSLQQQERQNQLDFERKREAYDDMSQYIGSFGLGADEIMSGFR
tara:strand:+ start:1761 stop:2264 length:504 start_codon:yes stop_codon:yes gene_type:complete